MPPDAPVSVAAFDEILDKCRQFLLGIANAHLPDELRAKGGASDLVQETLAAAHRSREQFRGRTLADLRAWLRGILSNQLAMFRRRYSDTASRDVSREVPLTVDALVLPAATPVPVEELSLQEDYQSLSVAVEQLPDDSREAVRLRFEYDLSFIEIGVRLGRSEEAARKLVARAVAQLRSDSRSADCSRGRHE